MALMIPSVGETDLVAPLYEGILQSPLWETFFARLARSTGARTASFVFKAVGSNMGVDINSGLFQSPSHFALLDNLNLRNARPYSVADLMLDRSSAATDLLNSMLAPLGLTHAFLLKLRERDDFDAWTIVAYDHEPTVAVGSLLTAMVPHLRVAFRLHAQNANVMTSAGFHDKTLDLANIGWCALDKDRSVVAMSAHAETIIQQSECFRIGADRRLGFSSPDLERDLSERLTAYSIGSETRPKAWVTSRVPWQDALLIPADQPASFAARPAVGVLLLRNPDGFQTAETPSTDTILSELYDLTPSEARVAASLAHGASIAATAERFGLTVETTRHYSKKIYLRTGSKGQPDLMRRVQQSVYPMRPRPVENGG